MTVKEEAEVRAGIERVLKAVENWMLSLMGPGDKRTRDQLREEVVQAIMEGAAK
jgi:hypothetical protein